MLDPQMTEMSVSMYSTSATAASRLKLGKVFETDIDTTAKVLFLEALVKTDFNDSAYEEIDGRKVVQYYVRRAFGVRIALQVQGWSVSTSLSLSSVAAKAQVSGQSVQYYVETLGLPDWLEAEVVKAVGIAGPLDENGFQKLRALMTVTLPAYLRRTPAENPDLEKGQRLPLQFDEYRLPADSSDDTFSLPRSINFAMTHLARGDSLQQAKEALRDGSAVLQEVSGDVIEQIYAKYAAISPDKDGEVPSQGAVMKARRWLQFKPQD